MSFGADIQVGIAGCRGTFTALARETDIPPALREGAPGTLGGQLGSSCQVLAPGKRGVDIPLHVNQMGRCVLSVVAFGDGPSTSGGGTEFAAPFAEWALGNKLSILPTGGLHSPPTEVGLYRFDPPDFLGLRSR